MTVALHNLMTDVTNVHQRKLDAPLIEEALAGFRAWRRAGQGGRLRDAIREPYGMHAERSGKESLSRNVAEAVDLYEYLTATLRKNREQLDMMRADHERYQQVFGLAPSHHERRRLILEYAARLGATKRELRKDAKAFGRWFWHGAVVDRYARKYARLEQSMVTLLKGAGRASRTLLEAAPADPRAIDIIWRQLDVNNIFQEFVHEPLNHRVRIALCDFVTQAASPLPALSRATMLDEQTVAGISRLAMDFAQDVWLQSAAIETLIRLQLPNAANILRSRMTHLAVGDDFFVRRRIIDLLTQNAPSSTQNNVPLSGRPPSQEDLWHELLPVAARDPSPFVRQGAAAALARVSDMTMATRELTRLALGDDQPSVRAAALVEGVNLVQHEACRTWFAALMGHVLDRDADPFVLRATLHVAADWCERLMNELGELDESGKRSPSVDEIEQILTPPIRRLRESAELLAVRRWAANTIERIWSSLDPRARRLRDALAAKLDTLDVDRRARFSRSRIREIAPKASKEEREILLGRVLAVSAQEDFGWDVEPGLLGWTITRGGEPRFRLWRLLFEMLHPSPEKRQAFSHTTGRVSEANLRVPSGILAEVSPTKVPGEPLVQPDEQSWRPWLPLVDDVLSSLNQWFRVHPVRFFTAQGLTTLAPPRWWPRRVMAWVVLTLRFYHYAKCRNWREGDSAAPDLYVRRLRTLGIKVRFQPHADAHGNPMADDPSVSRFFQPIPTQKRDEPTRDADATDAMPRPTDRLTEKPITTPPVSAPGATAVPNDTPSMAAPSVFGGLMLGLTPQALDVQWKALFEQYARYFMSVYENTVPQLFVFALVAFLLFFLRQWYLTSQIRRARRKVRLSIGGWGTRGKSGTERLKAALFNALGWATVSKSSGCEAMFLYSPPWGSLRELGLYRPYDKATIWEHHAIMHLAGKLDASVFLWECMGLTPAYVRVLQHEWSQDDLATITNAYPDHEDIQGPAGINVAETIARFIPTKSRLLTTEHQMRPVLTRQAQQLKTSLHAVGWLESGLLAPDILERFPYDEHPDNIALTTLMAEELGVRTDFALKEMADRIVPDIGVLKTYPDATVRTRRLAFTNGMSANERHGCLGNWTRLGFDCHDPETEPGVWITTVVNNRADRIARSRVFASILVRDLSADRHFLIGGNLDALQTYIAQAFDEFAAGVSLWPPNSSEPPNDSESSEHALHVLGAMARRFRIPTTEDLVHHIFYMMITALAETNPEVETADLCQKMLPHWQDPDRVVGLLRGAGIEEDLVVDLRTHLTDRLERLAEYRDFASRLKSQPAGDRNALDADFRRLLRHWFDCKLVVVEDYHADGERIIDILCTHTPPGFRNRIMGIQNIKGTGLDFVYRWLAWQKCSDTCDRLESQREEEFLEGLRLLAEFREYGQLCESRVRETLDAVHHAPLAQQERVRAQLDLIRVQFDAAMHQLASRLEQGPSRQGRLRLLYRWLDEFADPTDAVRRRRKADRIYRDLADQRISVERAVIELRRLSKRQKTGWIAALSGALGEEPANVQT